MQKALQFIEDVQSGKLLSCKWAKLAVEKHLSFYDNDKYYFDEEASEAAHEIFSLFRHTSGSYAGQPFTLFPWQSFIVHHVFGWKVKATGKRLTRKVYCEVAKKNGKTEFAAGIGLIGALFSGEPAAEVYSAANKFDQASICWDSAAAMAKFLIDDFDEIAETTKLYQSFNNKRIIHQDDNGITESFFRPTASDSKTLDGLRSYIAIIDEFHEAKDESVLHNLESGMVNRQDPLLWIITTAGFNINGPCHKYRGVITDILEGKKTDDTTFGIIFTLDEEDDWNDESVWIKANPSIGITPTWEGLRSAYQKALNEGSDAEVNFKTKNLNIWVRSSSPWIKDRDWVKSGQDFKVEDLAGRECFGAIDLASTRDLTCFGLVFPPIEGEKDFKWIGKYYCPEDNIKERSRKDGVPYAQWANDGHLTATEGNVTDYLAIKEDIVKALDTFQVGSISYDPWQSKQLAQELGVEGANLFEFRQTAMHFNEPIKFLEKGILRKIISHNNDPILRWMVGNVKIVRRSDLMKFDKDKSREKIDGCVVLAMCIGEYLHNCIEENFDPENVILWL